MNRIASLAALALAAAVAHAQPLTTAFTFQGELRTGAAPASGLYDFRFTLYDAPSGGSQLGPALCSDNITLSDGKIAVPLDFGTQFAGQQRFLEVQTRQDTGLNCSNPAGFTTLTPRQNLTASPNAVFSLNSSQLNNQPAAFYQSASNITSGTLPIARGGTGAGTAPAARLALDVPGLSTANSFGAFNDFTGGVSVEASSPAAIPLVVNAPSGQTTDLQSWNVNGIPLVRILPNGAIATSFYISAANQVLSPAFNYTTPQARSYAINAIDLLPANDTIQFTKTTLGLTVPVQTGSAEFYAPIHLPDGAHVTLLTAWVIDNYASGNVLVEIWLRTLGATSGGTSNTSSAGNSTAVQVLTIDPGNFLIDNDSFSYFIRLVWPGAAGTNITIRDLRLNYTVSTPLP
jgi:hypothetical protein